MAQLYAALCRRATRRGVLAGYREVSDRLHTVRGRVDFAEQARRGGPGLPLAVTYQEFDVDVPENRVLRAGLAALRSAPVHVPAVRRELHRLRALVAGAGPLVGPPPGIAWTRLNEHYRPAVELARMLLARTSVDLAPGAVHAPALVLDLSRVFEAFVRVALREALGVGPGELPDGAHAPRTSLDDAGAMRLEPDLGLWRGGRCRFVGEVKYKSDPGGGRAADRYQLLAYAIATGLPDATLVYADGPPGPAAHFIPGAGVRLHLRGLDLGRPPEDVLAQVARLAAHVEECAEQGASRRVENRSAPG